jgi:hypothetical protein
MLAQLLRREQLSLLHPRSCTLAGGATDTAGASRTAAGPSSGRSSATGGPAASQPAEVFHVGRQCAARVQLYHLLYHFEAKLTAKMRRLAQKAVQALQEGAAGQPAGAAGAGRQAAAAGGTPGQPAAAQWQEACSRVAAAQAKPMLHAHGLLLQAAQRFMDAAGGGGGWSNSRAYSLDTLDSVLARLAG